MDRLIAKISSGVGRKRKKSSAPILVRLSSKRNGDMCVLSDEDDSSDEDYVPNDELEDVTQKTKVTKKKRKVEVKQSVTQADLSVHANAWSNYIPAEVLLKIFQLAVASESSKLKLLLRLSTVCKQWRSVSTDPSLWHSLDLSFGWIKSQEMALKNLLDRGYLSQLRHLCLSECKKVNSKLIQFVVDKFPGLKSLNIQGCDKVRPDSLKYIARGFEGLEALNISNMNSCGELSAGICDILTQHCATLKKVEVAGCLNTRIHKAVFTSIKSLKQLTLLDISHAVLPDHSTLLQMFEAISSSLEVLRMSQCSTAQAVTDDLESETYFPNLIEFTAPKTKLTLTIFLRNAPNLKYLDLRGWNLAHMQCLFDGLSLPKLQSLNLCDVSLVNGIEMDLSMLVENLEELDISWLKNCSDSAFNCILTSLLGSTGEKLKVLHCSGTAIVMSQLRALLRNFPNLETLNIESCRQLPRGIKRKYEGKFEVTALRKKCALSA